MEKEANTKEYFNALTGQSVFCDDIYFGVLTVDECINLRLDPFYFAQKAIPLILGDFNLEKGERIMTRVPALIED